MIYQLKERFIEYPTERNIRTDNNCVGIYTNYLNNTRVYFSIFTFFKGEGYIEGQWLSIERDINDMWYRYVF